MTIKELKDYLNAIPETSENLEVKVSVSHWLRSIDRITWGVDMDTNIISLWICGDDKRWQNV